MIIGSGKTTQLFWFNNLYKNSKKMVFVLNNPILEKKTVVTIEPKEVHERWLFEHLKELAVQQFVRDVFDLHFNNQPIPITYPQAFGVCIRIKRKMNQEFGNIVI